MDNLKLNAETQEKFHPLIDTVKCFMNDTKMAFTFDKRAIINIRKDQVENQQAK